MNAGQTCVAPDYVLTTPDAAPVLADALADAVRHFYGSDPRASHDYGRIINEQHFDRLVGLLTDGTVASGGRYERAERYLEPTVLRDVDPGSALMQEEIFGPLLPIVEVEDLDEAIGFIGARPHPLAAYLFSDHEEHHPARGPGTAVRRSGRERHGQLPRAAFLRDVQPSATRVLQADPAGHAAPRLSALRSAQEEAAAQAPLGPGQLMTASTRAFASACTCFRCSSPRNDSA